MSFFSKLVESKSTALAVAAGAGAIIGLALYYQYYLASIKIIRTKKMVQEIKTLLMILILIKKLSSLRKQLILLILVSKTLNLS